MEAGAAQKIDSRIRILGSYPDWYGSGRVFEYLDLPLGVSRRTVVKLPTHAARLIIVFAGLLMAASCAPSQNASGTGAATQSVTTGQMTVTFTSEPDPPKAGDNSVLVTVKQVDGTPITDGSVTAVFSMPAMPTMNMPAMRSDATLAHRGGGNYRGTGQLSMSGTWNVTVSVSRSGQDLGTARFSVVAK